MGLELIKNPESWKEEWGLNSGHYTVEGLMYRAVEECVANMENQKMHPIMVIAEYIVEMKKYYPDEFISDKLLKAAAELLTENYNKVEADEIYYFMLRICLYDPQILMSLEGDKVTKYRIYNLFLKYLHRNGFQARSDLRETDEKYTRCIQIKVWFTT